ncbi:MAG: hypothetical protein ABIS08_09565 [Pseudolysinimonas sp.]
MAQTATVGVFFGVPQLVVAPLLLATAVFGLAGWLFSGRAVGAWWALTVLVWAPGCIAAFAIGTLAHGGQLDPSAWFPPLLGGVLPTLVTLLGYAGPTRAASLALITAAAVGGVVMASVSGHANALAHAQQGFGSTVRPMVATVPGFHTTPEIAHAIGVDTVAVDYRPAPVDPIAFSILTEASTGPVCGQNLYDQRDIETSCVNDGEVWVRSNAQIHEVSRVIHGHLVRVVGPTSTPESLLRRVLAAAAPMSDGDYDSMLLDDN